LVELAVSPLESPAPVLGAKQRHVEAAGPRRGARGAEAGVPVGGAVAVGAVDLDRRSDLAVDVAVAVRVLREVAVDAVHAEVEVDRREVDGFLELLRIVVRDRLPLRVEQRAFAVALVY